MTYGDHHTQTSQDLIWLLRQPQPPARGGRAVTQYRDVALGTARDILIATAYGIHSQRPGVNAVKAPAIALLQHTTAELANNPPAPMLELSRRHHLDEHLQRWQSLAKSAVVGGRDLTVGLERPDAARAWAATKDAADLARAIVVLDRLYSGVPNYEPLRHPYELNAAATFTSALATNGPLDYSIDQAAWRPAEHTQPVLAAGVDGAATAQRNVAVDLCRLPNATNLRHLLIAQHRVSLAAVDLAQQEHDSEQVERFTRRAEQYRTLAAAARPINGELGSGHMAVHHSAHAAVLLAQAQPQTNATRTSTINTATTLVDLRTAGAIIEGLDRGVYLVREPREHIISIGDISRFTPQWRAADEREHLPLRDHARNLLAEVPPHPPATAMSSRHPDPPYADLLIGRGLRPVSPNTGR